MNAAVDTALRGPDAYALARKALAHMEQHAVWPTPLNFELWLHYLGAPEGALGKEIERLISAGEPITDEVSETLAANFLPRARLTDEIQDAGAQLNKELTSVANAIADARKSQEAYGRTLAGASEDLGRAEEPPALRKLVENLTSATRKVQKHSDALERRLHASAKEVTRLREHLEQVRRDAMTDALTTLANRKAFDEQLARASAEAETTGAPLTVAVLDIDHFKRFNDTWGHQTGDQVIRYVASVIGRVGAAPRFAARYGGEEFGMIFPGESAHVVAAVLDGVREEIASRHLRRRSTNEDLGTVSVSAGLAERRRGEPDNALMERADGALYMSKRAGRNRVTNAEAVPNAA
jgi:diguanylate cyclase